MCCHPLIFFGPCTAPLAAPGRVCLWVPVGPSILRPHRHISQCPFRFPHMWWFHFFIGFCYGLPLLALPPPPHMWLDTLVLAPLTCPND
ncbi:unnamed protein product [Staurois parvus]|uniref:Secreted protein n=1 Tax=Staurois parvus TaxID=386267 RepID=A0ABN9DXA0_9NEOB|nr:unnamed protein product [Staurois parvus]